ncbi:hypothetical protein [Vibrio paucivorans]|uniref:Uncharacterized protein n=1 Tax=Vibrio paucivorans TaxID=2829489 RepID=A0A9X3HU12_9VIBR|nr:hypothetical protein [Vibrio paucivorans]MCW8336370.1 hypothetical protein [Vibrio paucivorans]
MDSLKVFDPYDTTSLTLFSPLALLKASRPTTKCRFVRHGDTVHLLVFMNHTSDVPFLRLPADSLYKAAKAFMSAELQ